MITRTLFLFSVCLFCCSMAGGAFAGQVITEDVREWAKHTAATEASLADRYTPNSIGIYNFQNRTGQSELTPLGKGLAFMLITDLSKIPELTVIERIRMQALVDELDLGESGLVDPTSAPRLGKMLQVQFIVGGNVNSQSPKILRIDSPLLNVPTSQIIGDPQTEGELNELFQMEKDLLFAILDLLKTVPVSEEQKKELSKPMSTSSVALLDLFRGLDYSDRGEYKKAGRAYRKALKTDPHLGAAQSALMELQQLGLISYRKSNIGLLESLRDRTSLSDDLLPEEPTKREPTPDEQEERSTGDVRMQW